MKPVEVANASRRAQATSRESSATFTSAASALRSTSHPSEQPPCAFLLPTPLPLRSRTSLPSPAPLRRPRRLATPPRAALHDAALSAGAVGAASLLLLGLQRSTQAGLLSTTLNRKLVHVATGPLCLSLWPLYSGDGASRYYAAAVPAVFAARLVFSALRGKRLAASLSRSGESDGREALQGPLVYVAIVLGVTLGGWGTSWAAMAVAQLACGDGLADIVGRRLGRGTEWGFGEGGKTAAGSAGFVCGAFAGSLGLLGWFHASGFLAVGEGSAWDLASVGPAVLAISVTCAAVEVLLEAVDDNVSIPLTAAVLSQLLGI